MERRRERREEKEGIWESKGGREKLEKGKKTRKERKRRDNNGKKNFLHQADEQS